jgi:hypothetical protein
MRAARLGVSVAVLVASLAVAGSAMARLPSRARCLKRVCPGFYELCREACQYAFDRSSQPLCRKACKVETVRRCRQRQCGIELGE